MPRREQIITKTKKLTCGHEQKFSTPVPREKTPVWCLSCDAPSRTQKYNRRAIPKWTVAQGRPRRLKKNPRSNNQYTKGRAWNATSEQ